MTSSRTFISLAAKIAALLLLASAPALLAQGGTQDNTSVSSVVSANNQFAFDFYRGINATNAGKNIFVSPYSISTALAMTFEGSRNNTRKQMASVLHFDLPDADRQAGFSELLAQTRPGPGKKYKLEVANGLWGQKDYPFEPAFTGSIGKFYGGGFNTVDYAGDKEGAIRKINTWVEGKTAGKIKNLIHLDDVTPLTRLVLTNAIYFKGDWASPFEKSATKDEAFHMTEAEKVQVPMIHQTAHFRFVKETGIAAIELPYSGDDLSMIVLLPDSNIDKIGEDLSLERIQKLRTGMRLAEVEVTLPRFKFETRYILNDQLGKMGMPDAFDEFLADFSGMNGKKSLYISKVIHQAMIDVNEEGSEAAAATAVVMSQKMARIEMKETFRADHPFIFMIVHNTTGSILFMGRLSNPVS